MEIVDLFRKKEKLKYIVDKTFVDTKYIEERFHFLIESGYEYKFYQKYSEREFIYTLKDCRVEVLLDGYVCDCIIQTKDFTRANVTKNPLVDSCFKERFFRTKNLERIDMVVNLIYKNADIFLLK